MTIAAMEALDRIEAWLIEHALGEAVQTILSDIDVIGAAFSVIYDGLSDGESGLRQRSCSEGGPPLAQAPSADHRSRLASDVLPTPAYRDDE